jgi:sulfite exporter TauE/SafE
VGQNGRIFGFNSKLILDMGMILTGVLLLGGMLLNRRKTSKCGDCGALDHEIAGAIRPTGVAPLVIMGVAYGLTPCAPLLMILVLAAMMTPFQAVLLSLVFSIANAISPLIILSTLAGFLSQRMQREIPRLLWVFQINTFGLFIVLGSVSLYRHW